MEDCEAFGAAMTDRDRLHPSGGDFSLLTQEELIAVQTRLFDAESALAELVRLRDNYTDHNRSELDVAWSRARAVLAQIPCGDTPAPCNCDHPVLHFRTIDHGRQE